MVTYNHEKYIIEAIEGVIDQQTDFPYQLIIGEDFSTDNTRQICIEYQKRNPSKIKLLLHDKNLGGSGKYNALAVLAECTGKYIAMCDGDDYWIDPFKLQKQVDFLEANPDYAICFHRVYELEEGKKPELSRLNTSLKEETYTVEDLAKGNFIHTPSVIFRNGLISLPAWFKDAATGDYVLYMLNAAHGKIKYFPEAMAVYRSGIGFWSTDNIQNRLRKGMNLFEHLVEYFDNPRVLEGLINQQIYLYMYLYNQNDPIFERKNFLLYKRLIKMLNEKDARLRELSKNPSLLAKHVSGKELVKALIKKIGINFFGVKSLS